MDQDAEQRLGVFGVAAADGVFEGVGGCGQLGSVGRVRRFCGELMGELLVLVSEAVELGLERVHAALEAFGFEVAVLEGVEVPVDRALRALDLGGDCGAAVFECLPLALLTRARLFNRASNQVPVAVDVGELFDDGGSVSVAPGRRSHKHQLRLALRARVTPHVRR